MFSFVRFNDFYFSVFHCFVAELLIYKLTYSSFIVAFSGTYLALLMSVCLSESILFMNLVAFSSVSLASSIIFGNGLFLLLKISSVIPKPLKKLSRRLPCIILFLKTISFQVKRFLLYCLDHVVYSFQGYLYRYIIIHFQLFSYYVYRHLNRLYVLGKSRAYHPCDPCDPYNHNLFLFR